MPKRRLGKGVGRDRSIAIEVGGKIRLLRVGKGLSQTQLGDKMDLTFQQIQKYEKGVNAVSAARMPRLCRLLGTTPNELLGWDALPAPEANSIATLDTAIVRHAMKVGRLPANIRRAIFAFVSALLNEAE